MVSPYLLPDQHAVDVDELREMHRAFHAALSHEPPAFGSEEWRKLDEGDPRREAAAVVAGFCWWAAERGLAAPASPERLHTLIREETALALVETSCDVADALAQQKGYKAREAALRQRVSPAISYPPRCAA